LVGKTSPEEKMEIEKKLICAICNFQGETGAALEHHIDSEHGDIFKVSGKIIF
jgi:hypothetical protein